MAEVETRVVYDVTVRPARCADARSSGRFISLPTPATPAAQPSCIFARGRIRASAAWPTRSSSTRRSPTRTTSVPAIASSRSSTARGRSSAIVGVALSPEYVFATRGGEPIPDDRRFGVFWMNRKGARSRVQYGGAFNDVCAQARARASSSAYVIAAVDRLLDPYGGGGAYARAEQLSNRFLTDEIRQQKFMATTSPSFFWPSPASSSTSC